MNKKKPLSPENAAWAKAKKLCRLNMDDIRMAKELGFKPKSLIKNIPNKGELWKSPVKEWIRDLYSERFGESALSQSKPTPKSNPVPTNTKKNKRKQSDDLFFSEYDYLEYGFSHEHEIFPNETIREDFEVDHDDLPF